MAKTGDALLSGVTMNKIMVIGLLGRDPEMSYTPNGSSLKYTI